MTSFAEEVAVASIGELNSHTWAVIIGLHDEIEVVCLGSTCSELGVDVELTLPLATADSLRNSDLIGIAIMCSLRLSAECCPTVVGKPVAEGIEQCAVVNGLPEVGTALIVPVHSWLILTATFTTFRNDGAIIVCMILQHDIADIDGGST